MTETGKKETQRIWSTRRGRWGVVTAVTILPLLAFGITTNSAQAQPGSRVCGAYWEGTNPEVDDAKIRRIQAVEVPKTDLPLCAAARDELDNYEGPEYLEVGGSRAIDMMTCEDFGKLANNTLGADPCLNMERRDNAFDKVEILGKTITL